MQNQALSGILRGMMLHDLPRFHMILHDPFGAQGPRNVPVLLFLDVSVSLVSFFLGVSLVFLSVFC